MILKLTVPGITEYTQMSSNCYILFPDNLPVDETEEVRLKVNDLDDKPLVGLLSDRHPVFFMYDAVTDSYRTTNTGSSESDESELEERVSTLEEDFQALPKIPALGTIGQVLAKVSNGNYDYDWTTVLGQGSTVYVDSVVANASWQDGSVSFPYATIQQGINASQYRTETINGEEVYIGDTIRIASGFYQENVTVPTDKHGIFIEGIGAIGQRQVLVDGSFTVEAGSDHIGMHGLLFTGDSAFNASGFVYVDNCEFNSLTTGISTSGVYLIDDSTFHAQTSLNGSIDLTVRKSSLSDGAIFFARGANSKITFDDVTGLALNWFNGRVIVQNGCRFANWSGNYAIYINADAVLDVDGNDTYANVLLCLDGTTILPDATAGGIQRGPATTAKVFLGAMSHKPMERITNKVNLLQAQDIAVPQDWTPKSFSLPSDTSVDGYLQALDNVVSGIEGGGLITERVYNVTGNFADEENGVYYGDLQLVDVPEAGEGIQPYEIDITCDEIDTEEIYSQLASFNIRFIRWITNGVDYYIRLNASVQRLAAIKFVVTLRYLEGFTGTTVVTERFPRLSAGDEEGGSTQVEVYPETSSSTTARTVTIPNVTSYDDLLNKVITISTSVSNGTNTTLTLNVNGLGAKPLVASGTTGAPGTQITAAWYTYLIKGGTPYQVVYNGTQFVVLNREFRDASTTAYGYTQLNDSIQSTSTNTAATANAVSTVYAISNDASNLASNAYSQANTATEIAQRGGMVYAEDNTSTATTRAVSITWVNTYDDLLNKVITIMPNSSNLTNNAITLNVNGLGTIPIVAPATANTSPGGSSTVAWNSYTIKTGVPYQVVYNGTQFVLINRQLDIATSARYGASILSDSVTSNSTSQSATPNSVKTAYDAAINVTQPVGGFYTKTTGGGWYKVMSTTQLASNSGINKFGSFRYSYFSATSSVNNPQHEGFATFGLRLNNSGGTEAISCFDIIATSNESVSLAQLNNIRLGIAVNESNTVNRDIDVWAYATPNYSGYLFYPYKWRGIGSDISSANYFYPNCYLNTQTPVANFPESNYIAVANLSLKPTQSLTIAEAAYNQANAAYNLANNAASSEVDLTTLRPVIIGEGASKNSASDNDLMVSLGVNAITANGSVSIGYNATSSLPGSVTVGYESSSTAANAVAVGRSSNAVNTNSVAIGFGARTGGVSSIAIGANTFANGANVIHIGTNTSANASSYINGGNGLLIGSSSFVNGVNTATVLGFNQSISASEGNLSNAIYEQGVTAIGRDTVVTGSPISTALSQRVTITNSPFAIAIGNGASVVNSNYGIALGNNASSRAIGAIAFGYNSYIEGCFASMAIGYNSTVNGNYSMAIGYNATATGRNSMAIGNAATANFNNTLAIGHVARAFGDNSTAIGSFARVYEGATDSMALGSAQISGADVVGALGISSTLVNTVTVASSYAIGIGSNLTSQTPYGVAIGTTVFLSKFDAVKGSIVIGNNSQVGGEGSIGIGDGVRSSIDGVNPAPDYTIAIGSEVNVAVSSNVIAIGTESSAYNSPTSVVIGAPAFISDAPYAIALGNQAAVGTANNGISIGTSSQVSMGDNGIAIGLSASSHSENAVAMGVSATSQRNGVAIGGISNCYDEGVSVGYNSYCFSTSVAVGSYSSARDLQGVALGSYALSANTWAVSIGPSSSASGTSSVAIGYSAMSQNTTSIAIGSHSIAPTDASIAMGADTNASGNSSIAIGNIAQSSGFNAIAIGTFANCTSSGGIVIGNNANTGNITQAIAIGSNAVSWGVALGSNPQALGSGSIAIGGYGTIKSGAVNSIAIGTRPNIGANASRAIAIGLMTNATGSSAVAIGAYANAEGFSSIALGRSTNAVSNGTIALGNNAYAVGLRSIAIGQDLIADNAAQDSIAIGWNTSTSLGNSIVIGWETKLSTANAVRIGRTSVTSIGGAAAWSSVSDRRDKTDIKPVSNNATDFISELNAVTYRRNPRSIYRVDKDFEGAKSNVGGAFDYDVESHSKAEKAGERERFGFIAQDVLELCNKHFGEDVGDLVNDSLYDLTEDERDGKESELMMQYSNLIPIMVKSMQEMNKRIEELESKLQEV